MLKVILDFVRSFEFFSLGLLIKGGIIKLHIMWHICNVKTPKIDYGRDAINSDVHEHIFV